MKKSNLLDRKFDRLTVTGQGKSSMSGQARWICKCECGGVIIAQAGNLKSGHTRSCGCLKVEAGVKSQLKLQHQKEIQGFNWRGGKVDAKGYTLVWNPAHPYSRADGYIFEHRLVMEDKLGRYLKSWEIPHHKDEVKNNNHPDNLRLMTKAEHVRLHKKKDSNQEQVKLF